MTCILLCLFPDLDKVCAETVTTYHTHSHTTTSVQMYTKVTHLDSAGLSPVCTDSLEVFWLPRVYVRAKESS